MRPHFILNILLGCFFSPFGCSHHHYDNRVSSSLLAAPLIPLLRRFENIHNSKSRTHKLCPRWDDVRPCFCETSPQPLPALENDTYCVAVIITWDGVRLMLTKKSCMSPSHSIKNDSYWCTLPSHTQKNVVMHAFALLLCTVWFEFL